jgi:outer membrane protein TolC
MNHWEGRALKAEAALETVQQQRDQLRAALVGLVGVDGREELEPLEGVMRVMVAPAKDKAASIDAIHALLATLPTDGVPWRDGATEERGEV